MGWKALALQTPAEGSQCVQQISDERFLVTMRHSSAQYDGTSMADSITDSCMSSKISPAKAVAFRIGAQVVTSRVAACLTGKTERKSPDADVVSHIASPLRASLALKKSTEFGVPRKKRKPMFWKA